MKRSVLGLLGMVSAVLVGAPSAWAQQEKGAPAKQAQGAPVEVAVGYFPSWNGGLSGTVIKKKELWEKYLPAGSTVRWEVTLVGFPVFNAMLANRLQVGYIGDAPAMVATTKRDVADIRIVSLHHQSPGNICAIVLVRPDAPDLKTPDEWLKWLNGKRFGVAGRASCGDRFTSFLETRLGVKFGDKAYLGPEVIRTQLQAGTIDAAQQFEPHVSQIVASGIAKIAFTPPPPPRAPPPPPRRPAPPPSRGAGGGVAESAPPRNTPKGAPRSALHTSK